MQLFLASILSCAAVLVGVLAQTDWKPYSSPEGGVASLSDDARLFAGVPSVFDGNLNESLAHWTDYDRGTESTATRKILDRTRDASIRQRETKVMTESAGLLARNKSGLTFTDSSGRAVNFDFDFSEHSFEMLVQGGNKEKLAKAKKFFSAVSAIAEREIRKELVRSARQERAERRDAKRGDPSDEPIRGERMDRAEPVEAACPQSGEPVIRIDRSVRSNQ